MAQLDRSPLRGGIWFLHLPTNPSSKGRRPVIVVSSNGRNRNPRADTVLEVPLTTSVHRDIPTHILLVPGETGLLEDCCARAEDITVVRKDALQEARTGLRILSNSKICQIAAFVFPPEFVRRIWRKLSRSEGQVKFHVTRSGATHQLGLPGSRSLEINGYLNAHEALKGA